MEHTEPNELKIDLLGIMGLNPFIGATSSARAAMFSSHIAQRLITKGCTPKRIQTGIELELAKTTFSTKMPVDGIILKIIERYPKVLGSENIPYNPETLVIYEDNVTKEIGCFTINNYKSFHQYFGFENKFKPTLNLLSVGNFIPKDTIFADSPAVSDNGGYNYGTELNIALMSHPGVSEDGIVIADDALEKLSFKLFETRTVEFGSGHFPLNLYGTPENYKAFPEIGEYIRDDGILMMLRSYDFDMSPVEMSIFDVMEPDATFDKAVYVRGGKGKIIDIRIRHDDNGLSPTPMGIEKHMNKYILANKRYYQEIIEFEKQLQWNRKKKTGSSKLDLKPEFHRLVIEAMVALDEGGIKATERLNKVYRKQPVDDYRIDFTIEYEIKPNIGFKLTDGYGGKGVIVDVIPGSSMPVDKDGNRADIIMDGGSVVSRMNIGRLYEQYISSSARDMSFRVRERLGLNKHPARKDIKTAILNNEQNALEVYNYLLDFYKTISLPMFEYFSILGNEHKLTHLENVCLNGIYIYFPTDNQLELVDIIKNLEKDFPTTYGPVTYTGNSGIPVTTEKNIRIGPMYIMLLEKIADDWSAVSSGTLQHFGVLAPMIKNEKYSAPYRNSPVKTIGETEGRIFASYTGREAIAEMMDRNNNPITHKFINLSILNAEKPSNIEEAIDRSVVTLGGAKPIQLVNHITSAAGWRFKYVSETKEDFE